MKTKHLPLIIGIALPIIFILIISLVILVPTLNINPAHDFIYTTEDPHYRYDYPFYKNTYVVSDGKISLKPVEIPPAMKATPTSPDTQTPPTEEMPTLYFYDVETDTSRQISFEDAQQLTLDPGPASPDGYTVGYRYEHDGIFEIFGSNDNNRGYFISKGNAKKKLNITNQDRYWSSDAFTFIGWVR